MPTPLVMQQQQQQQQGAGAGDSRAASRMGGTADTSLTALARAAGAASSSMHAAGGSMGGAAVGFGRAGYTTTARSIDGKMTLWMRAHSQWSNRILDAIEHAKVQPVAAPGAPSGGQHLLHIQLKVPFFRQTAFVPSTIVCNAPRPGALTVKVTALYPDGLYRPILVDTDALISGLTAAARSSAERTMLDMEHGGMLQLQPGSEPVSYFGLHMGILACDLEDY